MDNNGAMHIKSDVLCTNMDHPISTQQVLIAELMYLPVTIF